MRFGIAVREITPSFPMPMYGYGARKDNFDGVNDPLTLTALILEEAGRRALIVAADLGQFPDHEESAALRERLGKIVGCEPNNVLLNASHSHGSATIPLRWLVFRPWTQTDACRRYQGFVCDKAAEAAGEAVERMAEGTLWIGEGRTSLPMNRRPDRNGQVPNAPNPGGPTDSRLFVLAIADSTGALSAVGMRISCHPVATGAQHLLTADYPGAWRAAFSRAFGPAVTPFFLQGAGADARPHHVAEGDHWRQMPHAELDIVGRDLLAESLVVLTSGRLSRVDDLVLKGTVKRTEVPCERRYVKREDFKPLLGRPEYYIKAYAEECLALMDKGQAVPDHATFHMHTLWLNREWALIGVDSEPLCGLGAVVESAVLPRRGILLGYTDGCVGYTPDSKEMKRGGYETESYTFQPWTGPMLPGIEHRFAEAVDKEA